MLPIKNQQGTNLGHKLFLSFSSYLSFPLTHQSETGATVVPAGGSGMKSNKGHMLIRRKSYLPMDNDTSQALQQYKPHERLGVPNES